MMLQKRPAVAKEERYEIGISNIGRDDGDRRGVRRQSVEACFRCSKPDEGMSKIVHPYEFTGDRAVKQAEAIGRDVSDLS